MSAARNSRAAGIAAARAIGPWHSNAVGFFRTVEMPQDLADVRVLHEIDHRRLSAGDEHRRVVVQAFVDHRAQRAPLFIDGSLA